MRLNANYCNWMQPIAIECNLLQQGAIWLRGHVTEYLEPLSFAIKSNFDWFIGLVFIFEPMALAPPFR